MPSTQFELAKPRTEIQTRLVAPNRESARVHLLWVRIDSGAYAGTYIVPLDMFEYHVPLSEPVRTGEVHLVEKGDCAFLALDYAGPCELAGGQCVWLYRVFPLPINPSGDSVKTLECAFQEELKVLESSGSPLVQANRAISWAEQDGRACLDAREQGEFSGRAPLRYVFDPESNVFRFAGNAYESNTATLSPDDLVRKLYAEDGEGLGPFFSDDPACISAYFDKRLAELLPLGSDPSSEVFLGFHPLVDGQDALITGFRVGRPTVDGRYAKVVVEFDNFGEKKALIFEMRRAGRGWKIADIISEDGADGWRLSDLLAP